VDMAESADQPRPSPEVIVVPCGDSARAGCRIVRRAVDLVARGTPELAALPAAACPRGGKRFVVAVDASSACQASAALKQSGVRPAVVISAPAAIGIASGKACHRTGAPQWPQNLTPASNSAPH